MKNKILKWSFLILFIFGLLFWLSGGDLQYLIILILFVLIFVAYEGGISRGKKARDEEIEEDKSHREAKKRWEKIQKKSKKNHSIIRFSPNSMSRGTLRTAPH